VIVAGYVIFYQIKNFFVSSVYYFFIIDKMASRAGCNDFAGPCCRDPCCSVIMDASFILTTHFSVDIAVLKSVSLPQLVVSHISTKSTIQKITCTNKMSWVNETPSQTSLCCFVVYNML